MRIEGSFSRNVQNKLKVHKGQVDETTIVSNEFKTTDQVDHHYRKRGVIIVLIHTFCKTKIISILENY